MKIKQKPNNPEWHHFIQKDEDTVKYFKKHGIDGDDFKKLRNKKGMGLIMRADDHRWAKKGLHSKKWNKEFLKQLKKEVGGGKNISNKHIQTAIDKLKGSSKFKQYFQRGIKSKIGYKAWKELLKNKDSARKVKTLLAVNRAKWDPKYANKAKRLVANSKWGKKLFKKGLKNVPIVSALFMMHSYYSYNQEGYDSVQSAAYAFKDSTMIGTVSDAAEWGTEEAWKAGRAFVSHGQTGLYINRINNASSGDIDTSSHGASKLQAFQETFLAGDGSDGSASKMGQ